jgi:hypothetical protein
MVVDLSRVALRLVHHVDFLVVSEEHLDHAGWAVCFRSCFLSLTIIAETMVFPATSIEPAFWAMTGVVEAPTARSMGRIIASRRSPLNPKQIRRPDQTSRMEW